MIETPDIPGTLRDRVSRLTSADRLGILFCFLLGLVVRLTHFRGVYAIDDFNYLRHASEIADGRFHLEDVLYWHGMRPFVFVPVAWAFKLFGVSEVSGAAWPLLASVLVIAIVYLLACDLHSRAAGLFAGICMAILPMSVVEATRVMPSEIMNFLIGLSAFAFVRSEVVERRRMFWLFSSGAVFAMIPWAGHLGLLFGAFFPVAILCWRRHPILSYWPLAGGAFFATALLTVAQLVTTGNPLANLDVVEKVLTNEQATPKTLFYFKLLARPFASHGGVLYLSVFASLVALFRRQRGTLLALGWFLSTYLLLEFGSSSFTEYRTLFKQDRYLTMVAVPVALLAGIGFAELRTLLSRWTSKRVGMAGVIVVLAGVSWGSMRTLAILGAWPDKTRDELHEIRDVVRAHRGQTIYVMHWLWNTRVGFYMGYAKDYIPTGYAPYQAVLLTKADPHSRNRYVQTLTPGERMAGGLLLLDEHLLRASLGERKIGLVGPGEVPETLLTPPPEWHLVKTVQHVAMYEIPDGSLWPGAARAAHTDGIAPTGTE